MHCLSSEAFRNENVQWERACSRWLSDSQYIIECPTASRAGSLPPVFSSLNYASGILRKPTAKRFQPLIVLIATVRSTISLGLKCWLSNS